MHRHCDSQTLVVHACELVERVLARLRQLVCQKPRLESLTSMPLHHGKGNILTTTVTIGLLVQIRDVSGGSYSSWRKVAGGVGAFAGDGVGKWAAVAVAPTLGRVPMFVFSDATDWRRT